MANVLNCFSLISDAKNDRQTDLNQAAKVNKHCTSDSIATACTELLLPAYGPTSTQSLLKQV